ncbi:hypothetical protein DSO57_1012117 [Entomophthora muscae]|uniref:Uncharacterized protein n=1 Tax=Entomophthora muscae TaxID=34485 RepID=A0ACC2SIX0_9FUNG|nr:hypothetical protein DSO57_1012117 [Entomophthora muscae]
MRNRGREFIGGEFARLLQDWYRPTEGLAPAEVQVYGGDACLVIGKVLEEFALMQAKYKLLTNHSPLLENANSSKLVPGYNPGHTLGTGDQEPHMALSSSLPWIWLLDTDKLISLPKIDSRLRSSLLKDCLSPLEYCKGSAMLQLLSNKPWIPFSVI